MHISIARILSGTPIWVFILLAYLLWTGVKRLKPGLRELAKIGVTPGIFIVWGVTGLIQRPGDFSTVLARWAVGAGAGYFFGWSVRFIRGYRSAPQADLADWRPA